MPVLLRLSLKFLFYLAFNFISLFILEPSEEIIEAPPVILLNKLAIEEDLTLE
jgi:hypothetical protein